MDITYKVTYENDTMEEITYMTAEQVAYLAEYYKEYYREDDIQAWEDNSGMTYNEAVTAVDNVNNGLTDIDWLATCGIYVQQVEKV